MALAQPRSYRPPHRPVVCWLNWYRDTSVLTISSDHQMTRAPRLSVSFYPVRLVEDIQYINSGQSMSPELIFVLLVYQKRLHDRA
jgi:hypothetical protein